MPFVKHSHTHKADTYTFLKLKAVLEEEHERSHSVLAEVEQADRAVRVHGFTCEKLNQGKVRLARDR